MWRQMSMPPPDDPPRWAAAPQLEEGAATLVAIAAAGEMLRADEATLTLVGAEGAPRPPVLRVLQGGVR